jgi:quercetin dioxygenase-like cupin family protein
MERGNALGRLIDSILHALLRGLPRELVDPNEEPNDVTGMHPGTLLSRRDESEKLRFFGGIAILRSDPRVGGSVAMIEHILDAGSCTPVHRHTHESEMLYVIEGALTVLFADRRVELEVGDTITVQPGTVHAVHARTRSRVLGVTSESGFVDFVRAVSTPIDAPPVAPDMSRVHEAAALGRLEILAPPPLAPT